MRHMRTVTVLTALALPLGLMLGTGAPVQAADETCDGRAATIVVAPAAQLHFTEPVTGTPGDA